MNKIIWILALSGLLISLAAPAGADNPFVANIGADGIQRIDMVAGSYFFKPNYISVKAKVPVEITIRKESGLTPHSFVLNAPEVGIKIKEDLSTEPKVIRFTAQKPGKYEFSCDKKKPFGKSHLDEGMKGILEVVP